MIYIAVCTYVCFISWIDEVKLTACLFIFHDQLILSLKAAPMNHTLVFFDEFWMGYNILVIVGSGDKFQCGVIVFFKATSATGCASILQASYRYHITINGRVHIVLQIQVRTICDQLKTTCTVLTSPHEVALNTPYSRSSSSGSAFLAPAAQSPCQMVASCPQQ
jgi:hypothetical protein